MKKLKVQLFVRFMGLLLLLLFVIMSLKLFNFESLKLSAVQLLTNPLILLVMIIVYGLSFFLRAFAWHLYLNQKVSFHRCLDGLWYSLLINHILPFKVGDIVRAGVITSKEKQVKLDDAIHSVVVMRLIDLVILVMISGIGMVLFIGEITIQRSLYVLLLLIPFTIGIVFSLKFFKPALLQKHIDLLKVALYGKKGLIIITAIIVSWLCEAIVIYGVAYSLSLPLSFLESIWVNSLTVGGQVFQITPGGIATYETIMAFALVNLQIPWEQSYMVALLSHLFKFMFSYGVGVFVIIKSPIPLNKLRSLIKRKGVRSL